MTNQHGKRIRYTTILQANGHAKKIWSGWTEKLHKRKPEFEIEVPFLSKKEKQIEIF